MLEDHKGGRGDGYWVPKNGSYGFRWVSNESNLQANGILRTLESFDMGVDLSVEEVRGRAGEFDIMELMKSLPESARERFEFNMSQAREIQKIVARAADAVLEGKSVVSGNQVNSMYMFVLGEVDRNKKLKNFSILLSGPTTESPSASAFFDILGVPRKDE